MELGSADQASQPRSGSSGLRNLNCQICFEISYLAKIKDPSILQAPTRGFWQVRFLKPDLPDCLVCVCVCMGIGYVSVYVCMGIWVGMCGGNGLEDHLAGQI